MKKSIIALLLLPLMLGACDFNPSNQGENTSGQTQQNEEEEESSNHNHHQPINHNGDDEEEEEEEENTGENEGNTQENTGISLDEWKEFEFHNGHKPTYNPDWVFDFGGSINPRGCLWENPNEAVDYSGIEFSDKKQFLSSPIFNTYPKVEMRFQFWFSSHNKGKSTNGEPTFKIEEYSETEKLLNTDIIDIQRSDIPNNNTALEKRIYVTQSSMTHFKLQFNNRIANGSGDYTPILCKISLKGWPKV